MKCEIWYVLDIIMLEPR